MGTTSILDSMVKDSLLLKVKDWWSSQKLDTVNDYMTVLENFRIIFTCNSNMIEGSEVTYHTTRDVFEGNNITGYTGPLTDLLQIQNQKFAFNFLVESLVEKRELDLDFIKKLHKIMLHGCYDDRRYNKGERPGKFKVHDYCVGTTDVGSLPEDVLYDVVDLVEEVNEMRDFSLNHILTTVAYFHLRFESIHPFADGNGRVGRTLMNYLLMLYGLPPIVIFNEDREVYYMALEVWDRTGEISGFIEFLKEQLIKTWKSKVGDN